MRGLPVKIAGAALAILALTCGCGKQPTAARSPSTKRSPRPAPAVVEEKPFSPTQITPSSVIIAENTPPQQGKDSSPPVPQTTLLDAAVPQKVFRPTIRRREFDESQLAKAGVKRYESKHLRLFTDIPAERAQPLPAVVDAVYGEWEKYFGALPPDHERTPFQITGYLMSEREKYRDLGLLPVDLPPFIQGRHRGAEFWMVDQATDYYRRHLVLHEATHSYMAFLPQVPLEAVWYLEGIAELFGTHETDAQGKLRFRVFPAQKAGFANWGRTEIIREEIKGGHGLDLPGITHLKPNDFLRNSSYGWAWGLCQLLDQHPRYRDRFHRFVREARSGHAAEDFQNLFGADLQNLLEEWLLFSANVDYGFDIERSAIDFRAGKPLNSTPANLEIAANRGWQSSGVQVVQGKRYRILARGQCTVAQRPMPWESEPQGISIRYAGGRPVGLLLGTVRADSLPRAYPQTSMLQVFAVGRELRLNPEVTGTLYLRVNDFWSELADNNGAYRVEIQPASGP